MTQKRYQRSIGMGALHFQIGAGVNGDL